MSSSLGVADIIGIVVGGVLAIATVIGLVVSFYAMCCKKKNSPQVWPQQNQYNSYYPQNRGGGGGGYGQPMNTGYGQPMNTGYYQQHPPYQQQQPSWNKQSNVNDLPPSYSSVGQKTNPSERR